MARAAAALASTAVLAGFAAGAPAWARARRSRRPGGKPPNGHQAAPGNADGACGPPSCGHRIDPR